MVVFHFTNTHRSNLSSRTFQVKLDEHESSLKHSRTAGSGREDAHRLGDILDWIGKQKAVMNAMFQIDANDVMSSEVCSI